MPDDALDKVLRLAGGTTKAYTRQQRGRPTQVHQYPTPHPAMGGPSPAPRQGGTPTSKTDFGKIPTTQTTWGKLSNGDVLDFGGEPWQVLHAFVFSNQPGKPNTKGVRTGAKSGNSQGATGTKRAAGGGAMHTKGGTSSGAAAKKTPAFTGPEAHILENLWSGKRVQVTLHANFKVFVY